MALKVDEAKLQSTIETGQPLIFKVAHVSDEIVDYLVANMEALLTHLRKDYLSTPMTYIIRELVDNTEKANVKRIFFKDRALDITQPADYRNGIEIFNIEYHKDKEAYTEKLRQNGYYTKFGFQVKDGQLIMTAINNCLPNEIEQARINDRIARAKAIKDIREAYMLFQDGAESAGLGIVTIILMLRKLGVQENAYNFIVNPKANESATQIVIPLSTITESQAEDISDEIARQIITIPKFPENILELEHMLSTPDTPFTEVSKVIYRDPALTAELLKMVNSAQFMLPNKVSNINDAVSLVGIRGLKSLLYSYGTQKVIGESYGNLDQLWEHAFRCAFYAYNLARNFRMKNVMEDAYTAGILHDLGKIVVRQIHPGILERINNYCVDKGIAGNFIENLAVGVSHAKVGSMIARKWNFPERIIMPIEFHHQPLLAPEAHRDIVFTVYMANACTSATEGNFTYIMGELSVFKNFDIHSEKDFADLSAKLELLYADQKKRFEKTEEPVEKK